ncbi:MAG: outer membrane lipoprotein-sorting protein [bacterium]
MKRKTTVYFILILVISFFTFSHAEEFSVTADQIVKKIDELYRSKTTFSEFEMQIITPHWERTLKMLAWTEKMDKTLIKILSPKKEHGIGTLRINNEMWNYLPNSNKVIKIPPSMMMSSWMGSDFSNDDLVKESSMLSDYTHRFITPEDANKDAFYIELKPKEDTAIVWSRIVISARKKDYIPLWQKYFGEQDKLMRVMTFKDIKEFNNKLVPSIIEIAPQNKKNQKTIIRYLDLKFDIKIDKDMFTLRNLRTPLKTSAANK